MLDDDAREPLVIEWRAGGHRLAYVAAIAENSATAVRLLTTEGLLKSPQFSTLLGPACQSGSLIVSIDDRLGRGWLGVCAVLVGLRSTHARVVLPEADRYLFVVLLLRVLRLLPSKFGLIAMRAPGAGRGTSLPDLARRVGKWALIVAVGRLPLGLDLMLLDDPLAEKKLRVWRGLLSAKRFRLNDPQDLFDSQPSVPPELSNLGGSCPVIAVIGSIDGRKQVDKILEAWPSVSGSGAWLVVAGQQTEHVRSLIASRPGLDNVRFVDRFLSNPELQWVLDRCRAVVVLYDGGLSSGIMSSAAARGRWVICEPNSRTGLVAGARGLAVSVNNGDLAGAMLQALSLGEDAPKVLLATRRSFASRALRSAVTLVDN